MFRGTRATLGFEHLSEQFALVRRRDLEEVFIVLLHDCTAIIVNYIVGLRDGRDGCFLEVMSFLESGLPLENRIHVRFPRRRRSFGFLLDLGRENAGGERGELALERATIARLTLHFDLELNFLLFLGLARLWLADFIRHVQRFVAIRPGYGPLGIQWVRNGEVGREVV